MAEPLLTKDSINIGGHKFPIALIGGLAAVATVIIVLRARQQGQNVASVGQAPSALDPSLSGFSPDLSTELADLSAQIAGLQNGINSGPAPTPTSSPLETAMIRAFGAFAGTSFGGWDTSGQSGPPAYLNPAGTGPTIDLPFGSVWQVLGMSPSGLIELLGPTGDVWINPRDISGYSGPVPSPMQPTGAPIQPSTIVHGFHG